MISRPAEGSLGLLLLSNGFGVFSVPARRGPSERDCCRLLSRAIEHAATSPFSRVTAAAFPLASEYATASSEITRVSVFASFCVTAHRIPRTS